MTSELVRVELSAGSGAPGVARRAVRDTLPGWGLEELVDMVQLAVSELVTNAVLHSGSAPVLTLRHVDAGSVRVEVEDGAAQLPAQRQYALDSATGRGLNLVEGLSVAWGAEPTADGKVVWAEFAGGGPDPWVATDWLSDLDAG